MQHSYSGKWEFFFFFFFLLSGNVYVEPSQSCLFVNQPDSVQRLICRGQCQCIWEAAGNCPGFMVEADLCIGRAFTDLEKFWGVQVRWGPLCSHWGALPAECCVLTVGGGKLDVCLHAGACNRSQTYPTGEQGKHRSTAVSALCRHSWLRRRWNPLEGQHCPGCSGDGRKQEMEICIISVLRDIHVLNINSPQLVKKCCTCAMLSHSVMSDSLWPHGLYNPWNSAGQNPGVGCHALLQGIFLTQGSNPGLPPCRQILYPLSHQGSPRKWLCIGERNAGEPHARLWWVRSKKRAHEWVPAAVGQGVGERRREGDRKRGRAALLVTGLGQGLQAVSGQLVPPQRPCGEGLWWLNRGTWDFSVNSGKL